MPAPLTTPLITMSQYTELVHNIEPSTHLLKMIVRASDALQNYCGRRFDERRDVRPYTAALQGDDGHLMDAYTLMLDDDLRSVNTLAINVPFGATLASQGTVIASGYKVLGYAGRNSGGRETLRLVLDKTGANVFNQPSGDPYESIWIDGLWGYDGQWAASGAALSGAITNNATTATLSISGALERGMVIKIDSEYMYVESVSGTDVVISRGYNGSTAASHADTASISYWYAMDMVQDLVARLVQWRGEQLKSPTAGSVTIGDFTYPVDMSGLPKDVFKAINDSWLSRKVVRLSSLS